MRPKARTPARMALVLLALMGASCSGTTEDVTFAPTTAASTTTSASTSTTSTSTTSTTFPTTGAVRVAPDGSGDAPDLPAALEAVAPGGTIVLEAGEYVLAEPLVIEIPVLIYGAGSDSTTVAGDGGPAVIRFLGPGDLVLSGIRITQRGTAAASAFSAEGGTVSLVDVTAAGGVADDQGIGGAGFSLNAVTGSLDHCRALQNEGNGFEFAAGAEVRVTASTAMGNGRSGFAWTGRSGGEADAGQAEANGRHGFEVAEAAAPRLADNEATANAEGGFVWSGRARGEAEGNRAARNSFSGFIVLDEAQPVLRDNQAEENEDNGFFLRGTSRATLEGNRAHANAWSGFRWVEEASGRVQGNTADGNTDGFWVGDEAAPTLVGNVARDHHNEDGNGSGLVYSGTAGGSARDNEIFDNDWGIAVGAGATPDLAENDVHDNTANQINGVTFD